MDSAESLRGAIVATVRRMREEGLVRGTAGNVSARDTGTPSFWITPSGVDYPTMTSEDLVQVDLAGIRLSGWLTPSSDAMVHAAIYRQRSDVGGVVHTHSTYATVFAVLRRKVPALLVEAAGYLGGEVPVIEYVPPASSEVGEQVAAGLGRHRAVLLPNHGVIATGESVESAFTAALLVEHSARIAYLASLLGMPEPLPQGEVERMHRFLHEEYGQRRSPPTSGQRLPSAAE